MNHADTISACADTPEAAKRCKLPGGGRDGDPRRDRDQQDGSAGREGDAERRPLGDRARSRDASAGRRSSSPRRCARRASRRSGTRSSSGAIALAAAGELEERRRRNLAGEVVAAATARARTRDRERRSRRIRRCAELVASVQRREIDPLTAVDRIVSAVLRAGCGCDAVATLALRSWPLRERLAGCRPGDPGCIWSSTLGKGPGGAHV